MTRLLFAVFTTFCCCCAPLFVPAQAGAPDRSSEAAERPAGLTLACALARPESFFSAADAVVSVTVTGAPPPYQCSWNGGAQGGSGQKHNIACNPFSISGLTAGGVQAGLNYVLTVQSGSMSATCQVLVREGALPAPPSCIDFENAGCKSALLEALKTALTPPSQNLCRQWNGEACGFTERIYREGIVGIGTSNVPSGFRLAVKGGIVTDNVKISLCKKNAWCDYVFDPKYPLLPLNEVAQYIQARKSLPRTRTQAQVTAEGGYELGGVLLEHQEKIEEAYLHLIALDKIVGNLRQKVEALKAENESLKR